MAQITYPHADRKFGNQVGLAGIWPPSERDQNHHEEKRCKTDPQHHDSAERPRPSNEARDARSDGRSINTSVSDEDQNGDQGDGAPAVPDLRPRRPNRKLQKQKHDDDLGPNEIAAGGGREPREEFSTQPPFCPSLIPSYCRDRS